MIRIIQTARGRIDDNVTIEEVEDFCNFTGGDFAIELRGEKLHIFRVQVQEVR